jgi:hypothetical protein
MIRRIIPAALLPLLMSGVTLATVAWNRSGGRGPIVLSDRELRRGFESDENTGRSFMIQYGSAWEANTWLTAGKLASLGFDTRLDPASPDADAHYARALPRIVYVALELDGPAWQAWALVYEENSKRWSKDAEIARALKESSRLVPVDAESDVTNLERRYPDPQTHLITRGVVRLFVDKPQGGRPRLTGAVTEIKPDALNVPRELAATLRSKTYRVSVRYGRRYVPWISGIEP